MSEALLALPFGLAIGLSLGLVGGGGSVLAVPVLVYVLGQGVKEATTSSLLIVGATSLVGGLDHARGGRVRWRLVLGFGLAGAPGTVAGTVLNRAVGSETLLFAFSLLLLAAAYAMIRRRGDGEGRGRGEDPRGRTLWLNAVPAGLGVGVLTGFFGVGGGFVVVPALTLIFGLGMAVAVGSSLFVIVLMSAAAFAAHLSSGQVDWTVAGAFTGAAMVGVVGGSRLGERLSGRRLSQGFAVLLVLVAAFLIVRSVTALTG